MSDAQGRELVHRVAEGYVVSERVAARAITALFGQAIFEALKLNSQGGGDAVKELGAGTRAAGVAGAAPGGAGEVRGVVRAFPVFEKKVQEPGGAAGRSGGGAVFALERNAAAAPGQ